MPVQGWNKGIDGLGMPGTSIQTVVPAFVLFDEKMDLGNSL